MPATILDNNNPSLITCPNKSLFSIKPKVFSSMCFVHLINGRLNKLFTKMTQVCLPWVFYMSKRNHHPTRKLIVTKD